VVVCTLRVPTLGVVVFIAAWMLTGVTAAV
jgi:hypothetical protein